ncbi:excinuclease ABC subunit UvrC [Desulfovibrio mangrovi]|uniref:excinuclease ABC subunit UvrC n=1 Tax=Desulfovibrio mangrovi TaxID=2976983 RepID=UPI00224691A6|nr:excinuclease ABC subunit UvrC [Desulfovibrio mangrovi]UZP65879.1 excinuclease ABC subunit UvrC [Desulfovibrio mangrovi]
MDSIEPRNIPLTPGVYLFKDAGGHIIYVGKAKVLRKRLASYFRPDKTLTPKTRAMVRMAVSVDTLSTTSEKEALLLEASLIKKHRPRYNIVLRDDKQYILFKLTKRHEWPRLTLTRKVVRDGSAYFGPYTSAQAARDTWKAIQRVFLLRRCSDTAFRNRVRPCLYHHMGQCLGPCCLPVDNARYRAMVGKVELLLNGRSSELLELLQQQMLDASEALEFEKAAELRDQIAAIRRTVEKQAAVLGSERDMDVLGVAETSKGLALGVLFVRGGVLLDGRNFFWSGLGLEEAPEMVLSFLGQYYGPQSVVPQRIVIPWALEEQAQDGSALPVMSDSLGLSDEEVLADSDDPLAALAEALSELRGSTVRIGPPRGDAENRLVTMAQTNAAEEARTSASANVEEILAAKLGMASLPHRIEAVDVSHTGGRDTRVGVVVFEDGKPAKDQYRTYAFTDEESGGDDYGVLAAWMRRRLESGPPWPDLLLVDGGRGQLGAVMSVLEEAGCGQLFAVAAIAKARSEDSNRADRRKGGVADSIFLPGRMNPVSMRAGSPELLYLQLIRDAVHDYSLRRHRKARAGSALAGELQRIEGIGPSLAKVLWEHFSSIRDMADASEAELAALPGIGPAKARRIRSGLAAMRTKA